MNPPADLRRVFQPIELEGRHPSLHLLGDAYASRRMVFATRQAFELAQTLL
jgi:hypothetical protein